MLSESSEQIERLGMTTEITSISSFEQIRPKVGPEKLRNELEKLLGHSLNQWGVSQSISNSKINNYLLTKLKPISHKIYFNLYEEASTISSLEYAEYDEDKY